MGHNEWNDEGEQSLRRQPATTALSPGHDCACTTYLLDYAVFTRRHAQGNTVHLVGPLCPSLFFDALELVIGGDVNRSLQNYSGKKEDFVSWFIHGNRDLAARYLM